MFRITESVHEPKKKPLILNTLCILSTIKRRISFFYFWTFFLQYVVPKFSILTEKLKNDVIYRVFFQNLNDQFNFYFTLFLVSNEKNTLFHKKYDV